MNETILAVLITGVVSIICTLLSARSTKDQVTQELQTQNALQSNEIDHLKSEMAEMKSDIKEHNHYAKLFSENVPVLAEKIKVCEHRLSDLERKIE